MKLFNIDILANAVAFHETNKCTKGNSATRNNCFGIMTWEKGYREFKRYNTKNDSYKDFKRIWTLYYGGLPNLSKAKKYSGNDRPKIWLRNVLQYYYNHI